MVGLFGGSFDPIHHGHLIVARLALEALGLESLRFVPAAEQPLKGGRHHAGAGHRAAMVERAIVGEPRFAMETAELERAGPSYTVDTLRALHGRSGGGRLVLLLGADAAAEFGKWKEPGEIRKLADIVVLGRPGVPRPHQGSFRYLDTPMIDISATQVRTRVREGRSIRYWVPDAVASYIAAHGLYQEDAEC